MLTATPRSLVPVRVTVAPPMPVSPAPCTPSLFLSSNTAPRMQAGFNSPKLLFTLVTPAGSVMDAIWSLLTVPPALPALSLPSR